jgi:sulfite reductase beta subunit-like hemoprotein
MIWADKTHSYSATLCRHTGKTCPAAARMMRKLAGAMAAAETLTDEDFELTGTADLSGCPRQCTARYAASHLGIRLFAGVGADADDAGLNRIADALLNPDGRPLAGLNGQSVPCAMLDARPRPAQAARPQTCSRPAV